MRISHKPEDPANPLRDYPDAFLACRDVRHPRPSQRNQDGSQNWRWTVHHEPDTGHIAEMTRTMFCARGCGMLLTDTIDVATGRMHTKYTPPEGYPMPKGHAVSVREVRLELIRRALDEVAAAVRETR